jgi:D-arabinose 5-phosphate isomerase GutQ
MMAHIPSSLPVITMTSHDDPTISPLIGNRPGSILLPTPIPEPEDYSFGVSAPTTSTTVAMALGDSLALSIAKKMHAAEGRTTRDVFKGHHPGGAIGMTPTL